MEDRKSSKEFLPVSEVSEILNVSKTKAYILLNDEVLPFFTFGGVRRVSKRDLEEFIKKSKR